MTSILAQPLHNASRRTPRDRIREEYSENGRIRAVRTMREPAYDFALVWQWRSLEEVRAVQAFWRSTLSQTFDYIWPLDGNTYRARFLNAPQANLHAYGYWRIDVSLVGRRA